MNPTLEALQSAFAKLLGVEIPSPTPAPPPAVAPAPAPAAATPTAPASATPAVPAPTPVPTGPIVVPDPKRSGYHLDVTVTPDQVVPAAEVLDRAGYAIDAITGVDWMAAGQMEIVYDYFHFQSPLHVVIRTRVPRDNPELPSISKVYPGANWHERETHDFFGIRFRGHPDLTPLLLPEDATYHPLRKDFAGAA